MARIGGCPRCLVGDLLFQKDVQGNHWSCAQCGHVVELLGGDTQLIRLEARMAHTGTKIPQDYRKPRLPKSGTDCYPDRTIGAKP